MCAEVFYSFPLHLNPVHVYVMFSRKVYYSFIYWLFFQIFFCWQCTPNTRTCVCVCVVFLRVYLCFQFWNHCRQPSRSTWRHSYRVRRTRRQWRNSGHSWKQNPWTPLARTTKRGTRSNQLMARRLKSTTASKMKKPCWRRSTLIYSHQRNDQDLLPSCLSPNK